MTAGEEVRIGLFIYLRQIFLKPAANIQHNTYVSWVWNLFILFIILPFTIICGILMRAPAIFEQLFGGNGRAEDLIYLAEFFLFIFLLYVIAYCLPLVLLNVSVIYLLNRTFSPAPSSVQKVVSDHTNVLVQSFIWFYLGSVSLLAGTHFNSDFLQATSLFLYVLCGVTFLAGSIVMVRFYFRHARKRKFLLMYVASLVAVSVGYMSVVFLFLV
ncbi:hypothetical protein [Alkalicoccus luteus]|uniref:hypothetical protein n=1 Tax=Alkalicoccus luteus TaxID=1237094 RepID=UPI0040345B00